MDGSRRRLTSIFEVIGSTLAIAYALLVASNTGNEVLGFALLLVSSGLFALGRAGQALGFPDAAVLLCCFGGDRLDQMVLSRSLPPFDNQPPGPADAHYQHRIDP